MFEYEEKEYYNAKLSKQDYFKLGWKNSLAAVDIGVEAWASQLPPTHSIRQPTKSVLHMLIILDNYALNKKKNKKKKKQFIKLATVTSIKEFIFFWFGEEDNRIIIKIIIIISLSFV